MVNISMQVVCNIEDFMECIGKYDYTVPIITGIRVMNEETKKKWYIRGASFITSEITKKQARPGKMFLRYYAENPIITDVISIGGKTIPTRRITGLDIPSQDDFDIIEETIGYNPLLVAINMQSFNGKRFSFNKIAKNHVKVIVF